MSSPGQAQRATVLLAVTDPAERAGLARTLAEGGLGVTEAAGAAEALRRAAGDRPQLVLLGAPPGDPAAAEVCRRLGADPATAGIPVVLLAGEGGRNGDPDPPPAPAADIVAR